MKRFLKDNKVVMAELVTYLVMFLIGVFAIAFPVLGFHKPVLYSAVIFLVLAFFSFGGYFYTKENKVNYELLIFSLICIVTACFMLIAEPLNVSNVLGTGFLGFTVLTVLNRIYYIYNLKRRDNELYLLRSIALILLLFIAILSIQNFYRSYSEVRSIIIGYYFLSYGAIAFVEMLLFITINPIAFKKFVYGGFLEKQKLKSIDKIDSSIDKVNKIVKNVDKKRKKLHKR